MIALRLFLAVAAGAVAAGAGDVESWQSFDFATPIGERIDLTLTTQVRTKDRFRDFKQARFGPVLKIAVHPHMSLVGGYYYREGQDAYEHWTDSHRVFGGADVPCEFGRTTVQTRALLEHYFGDSKVPYNRFRHSVRVVRNWKVAPYAGLEYFVVKQGLLAVRYMGGARARLASSARLDVGYLFDNFHFGADRHAITTTLRFDLKRH